MSPRLRWILLASHVPAGGRGGGMVRYVVELASALAQRSDIDLHLRVRSDAQAWWQSQVPAARTWPVPALPAPLAAIVERAGWGGLEPRGVDVVQGAKHLLPPIPGHAVGLLTVHDMVPLDRPADFGVLKRHLLPGPYVRSLAEADALVCVSAATRERLLAYVPQARPRAHVVPLAPAVALQQAVPEPVPALVPGRFVLAVGDASRRKNLAVLTAAWPMVRRVVPAAVLAVVGPPDWGRSHMGAEADRLAADGALVRLGHVSDAELRWCYDNAAAVAFPSSLEGYGLPAAEARALGAPLVHSDDPAICEAAAGHGRIEPDDSPRRWAAALVSALQDPGRHPRPPHLRTWHDVAAETVEAARAARAVRGPDAAGRRSTPPAPSSVGDGPAGTTEDSYAPTP